MSGAAALLQFVLAVLAILVAGLRPAIAAEPPTLVVLLAVDQLRRDRVDPAFPGGLGRIAREGRVFADALLDHAVTQTCPGHVTMLSGRHPGPAGVPGNRFIDPASGRRVYCVEDSAEDARVFNAEHGRSPRLLRVTSLGDWMKAVRPATRVFSVSAKDRAAIAMAGKSADAAYWFQREEAIGFTTSRYYMPELSPWVRAWNARNLAEDGLLAQVPERWDHADGLLAGLQDGLLRGRPDDYFAEAPTFGRTSGRRLHHASRETFAERIFASPYLDVLTLEFTKELVRVEKLGRGAGPDLLALSLSATDLVGHLYGPESHEARDALRRLDLALGEFLDFLDRKLGAGRFLLVLTSDHGVLPLPEWLAETGRSECAVEGGRAGLLRLGIGLAWKLHRSFAGFFSLPKTWLHLSGSWATVNRKLAEEHGISPSQIVEVAEEYLEAQPAIGEVWTVDEIQQGESALAQLYRNSFDPERSGDLAVEIAPTCLISREDYGTSHGTPHLYDRAVPLIFVGPGVPAGRALGPAAPVDIAPTLAALLGIEAPEGLDGRVLFE